MRFAFPILVAALCSILSLPTRAHPHSWVDLKTTIEGNQHYITGFKMDWSFDAMTTAYIFDGEDMSAAHRAESLKKTAASVINNMLSTHYFTYFYDGKQPIRYKRVMRGTMTKSKGKARLRFELVLAKPYPLNNKTLKFLIFDPTYYIDMSWRKPPQDITFSAALKPFCHYKIIEPHPTPAQVSYAMSIPIDADPDNHLGQLFTQSMLLTCYNPESGL